MGKKQENKEDSKRLETDAKKKGSRKGTEKKQTNHSLMEESVKDWESTGKHFNKEQTLLS